MSVETTRVAHVYSSLWRGIRCSFSMSVASKQYDAACYSQSKTVLFCGSGCGLVTLNVYLCGCACEHFC